MTSIARIGIFTAMSIGINAPLLAIPNIELFSLSLFLSGLYLGFFSGLAVSLLAGIIYIFFNPNGPQTVFLVGIAQVAGFVMFAVAGSILRPVILKREILIRNVILLSLAGLLLTLWYDLSTNLVFALIFGPFWAVLLGGLAFGVTHIISNTIIFAIFGTLVNRIWKRIEHYMPSLAR